MAKKIKKDDNYLELVPFKNKDQNWEFNDQGLVQLIIPRNSLLDKIVRFFFKTPEVMRIDLDGHGSCVWKAIDGKRNVAEISKIVKAEFGENAEPLYERLGKYISILRNNKFITLEKVSD
ncbi:PqqD family protein [Marinisporobacter balticus]|uniref:Coenzyme PQQ synthesis protein D (PqqD) n=1 Tax=Marinisporobacter balticus TaxID=2018667 RepID=A0A4R2KMA1_9FIRM|nr:PqqD family protein [Marinisporobacter balticus]TCO75211.1 coenzyme PQQ synthesis protein D (PqqD) [Marinisporobacter balticus]